MPIEHILVYGTLIVAGLFLAGYILLFIYLFSLDVVTSFRIAPYEIVRQYWIVRYQFWVLQDLGIPHDLAVIVIRISALVTVPIGFVELLARTLIQRIHRILRGNPGAMVA